MLREIMKAERAAAEAGSWSDQEQPSLSYDASEDEEDFHLSNMIHLYKYFLSE